MAIPPGHLPSLRIRGQALGVALEHGVPERIIDGEGNGGVARDAADGLGTEQSQPLDLGDTGPALEQRKVCVRHNEVRRA